MYLINKYLYLTIVILTLLTVKYIVFFLFFRKLRNREAAQLSRDKKKAQFNILSGMVHGLRKEVCISK